MDNNFWKNKRTLVTGGYGFLGTHLIKQFQKVDLPIHDVGNISQGTLVPPGIYRFKESEYSLKNFSRTFMVFSLVRPHIVIHLAARAGGIALNLNRPADLFFDNTVIALHTILAMSKTGAPNFKKFVGIGSVCEYPGNLEPPFFEDQIWDGYPEESNAPYGLSKRAMLVAGQAFNKQYGLICVHLLLTNLYGEYDKFAEGDSHVIAALTRKFVAAKEKDEKQVVVWGDGECVRDFLHAEDAAKAIIRVSEGYVRSEPMNIGTGNPIRIGDLAEKIAQIVGYEGEIVYDNTQPQGQRERSLDLTRCEKFLKPWKPTISLDAGLARTHQWYCQNKDELNNDNGVTGEEEPAYSSNDLQERG